jgi:hypothetical protein
MEIGIERILAKNFMVVWCNLRGMGCEIDTGVVRNG